jgi:hypothetical protein
MIQALVQPRLLPTEPHSEFLDLCRFDVRPADRRTGKATGPSLSFANTIHSNRHIRKYQEVNGVNFPAVRTALKHIKL